MTARRYTPDLSWLTARPIAHRGLHDRNAGIAENTLAAARAAVAGGFAIECDVQRTADDQVVVFHDLALRRLTGRDGDLRTFSARELAAISVGGTPECIPTFAQLLEVIGGKVPLICEIKSRFDDDMRLADRVLERARAYHGPLALKSFDPSVIAHLRSRTSVATSSPLGIVAEAHFDDPEWAVLTAAARAGMAALTHWPRTEPDFLSYNVGDLPHASASLCRWGLGRPVMAWTVRTSEQAATAARWADQMIFEGFLP